jgi:predicted CXXCH cytochrome family protein
VCIFCHTAHNSKPKTPLWNRNLPVAAYTVYSSSSLKAVPGQPTGNSKLCLSCHDGTIAVGSVLSRGQPIVMSGGITTIPPGKSNLGTDLSDDHPISFRYDDALAGVNPKLRSPKGLPPEIKLDSRLELQCTSCHDAHNNQYGKFLVLRNDNSQLCSACHNQGTTDVGGHLQCAGCHTPHTAPSRAYLLTGVNVTQTCLKCHSGSPGANQGPNIAAAMQKTSRHDTNSPVDQKDHVPANVVCNDCHEGHTMRKGTATVPNITPRLGRIGGVNAAGTLINVAQFEYEVCFKCHDNLSAIQPWITRQFILNNIRLKVATASASYHPIVAQGKNLNVPSLLPPWTTASRGRRSIRPIACSSCSALPKAAVLPRLPAGRTIQSGGCQSRPCTISNTMLFWPSRRKGLSELSR